MMPLANGDFVIFKKDGFTNPQFLKECLDRFGPGPFQVCEVISPLSNSIVEKSMFGNRFILKKGGQILKTQYRNEPLLWTRDQLEKTG